MIDRAVTSVTVLPAEPESVTASRGFVRDTLRDIGSDDSMIERAELVVSELVTNAVLHARCGPTVTLHADAERVLLEVQDAVAAMPALQLSDNHAVTGRGLGVVRATATDWGVEKHPRGKTVWASFAWSVDSATPSTAEPANAHRGKHVLTGSPFPDASVVENGQDTVVALFQDVSVDAYIALQQHNDALLRECELLAIQVNLGDENDAIPASLAELVRKARRYFGAQITELRAQVHYASARGEESIDLRCTLERSNAQRYVRQAEDFTHLFDDASQLSAEGLLLLAPPPKDVTALCHWFLSETQRQLGIHGDIDQSD